MIGDEKRAVEFRSLCDTLHQIQRLGRLRDYYVFPSTFTKFSLCGSKLKPMLYARMNDILRGYLMACKNNL